MDTRPKIEPPHVRKVLSVTFNEDKSMFAVGLEDGFMVCGSDSGAVWLKKELMAGIGLAQVMGSTNVIALVGGGRRPKFAANKVVLWDEAKQKGGIEITTLTPVRAVRISQGRVVVVLQNSVQTYNLKQGKLTAEYETADNLGGLCCMSHKQIAFPGRTPGQVQIVEILTGNVSIIPAHSTALRALTFSRDGELLATASDQGTIIRVYNTSNCARTCEFRRGMDYATIFDLCFSPSGSLLGCTSDKGTLHIFDVAHPQKPEAPVSPITASLPGSRPGSSSGAQAKNNDGKGKWGWLGSVPLLPRVFSDTYSFASVPFSTGDEPTGGLPLLSEMATLGTTKPQKGIIGWFDEASLVVVGAGVDARWEKFQMAQTDDGKRFIARIGWKRYCNDN